MTNEKNKIYPLLKSYHVFLLGCIISSLLIFHSKIINNQRNIEKLNKNKSKLFDKIISKRYLSGEDDEGQESETQREEENRSNNEEGINKVCKKGSESLRDYYKTGDLSKIEIDEDNIECKEKNEDYLKALLRIINTATGESSNRGENQENSGNRNLIAIDDIKDDLIIYLKHLIPIIIFLVVAILSIPGWVICCFCCCCNCCCCCCCKKPGCKIPCFIFTYIFYALAVVICIYGLSQTNHIFVGLADTECSVLKFFDEVLNGEIKTTTPRWAGIEKINEILNKITDSLDVLQNGTLSRLDTNKNAIKGEKNQFLDKLKDASNPLFDGNDYSNDYSKVYSYAFTGYSLSGRYILDIIKMFGKYNSGTKKFEPENCTLDLWQQEYQTATDIADGVLSNAKNTLSQITGSEEGQSQTGEDSGNGNSQENPSGNLGGNEDVGGVIKQLNDGKKKFDEIKGSFGDINSEISGKIIDYSDTIDHYGKLGSKLVFTVLGLMNIALAVLILLICFCSGKTCTNCCCCRCIFKIFTHVLWNILALLMIITFLVGFLFSLVGTVGNDAMSAISYVVSKENLGVNGIGGEGILVNKLEEAKGYLYRCIHGDGKIEEEIGLNRSYIESFNNLTSISKKINDSINSFADMIDCHVYNITYEQLFRRENLEDELMLVHEDIQLTYLNANNQDYTDFTKFMIFKNYLSKMNEDITKLSDDHQNEKWVTNDDASSCDATTLYDSAQEFALSKCDPMSRNWISGDTSSEINYRANIISDTLTFLRNAKDESTGFLSIINGLKTPYIDLLNHYITTLREFGGEIGNIIGDITQYIDEDKDNIFDFINGKFIGTNLKIVLKYLKIALGKDLKTIGICLIIVGFALALSISSTILLLIVINVDIDNNKSLANQVPEYKFGSEGRVIQYQ